MQSFCSKKKKCKTPCLYLLKLVVLQELIALSRVGAEHVLTYTVIIKGHSSGGWVYHTLYSDYYIVWLLLRLVNDNLNFQGDIQSKKCWQMHWRLPLTSFSNGNFDCANAPNKNWVFKINSVLECRRWPLLV